VAGRGRLAGIRKSRRSKWRATVLTGVHLLIALHATHYLLTGRTLSPVEPSESMYTLELGQVNAGFVFFAAALLSTLLFGRFLCGWGCHLVALQDLCGWMMKKLGVRPRPFRSRLLLYVPLALALYMFAWPTVRRVLLGGQADVFPGFSNHLVTSSFWATFPGPVFAVLTFAVCGFGAVYLLGAKGFCTYGCPYGAMFGGLDRLSPGRILVNDACEQCGHCTATCTSNVRVHEEVRLYGMVVDPGCMKCTDCVSVCPMNALYYGFSRPSGFKRAPSSSPAPRRYDFTRWEELALLGVGLVAFLAIRGLYDGPPLLMSVGLGGLTAFLALKLWRIRRDATVRLQNLRLKLGGRIQRSGWIFVSFTLVWLAFTAHSTFAQWHRHWGVHHLNRTEATRAEVLSGEFRQRQYSDRHDAAIERALRHLSLADRWGLVGVVEVKLGLGWLHMLRDEAGAAESRIREAVALAPHQADQYRNLSEFLLARGRLPEAIEAMTTVIEIEESRPADRFRLAGLLAAEERYDEAVEQYEAFLRQMPESAEARYNLGGVLRRQGRAEEAIAQLQTAGRLAPDDPDTQVELGLAYMEAGRIEEALGALKRAVELAPDRPESRLHLSPLIRRLEQMIAADGGR
jgi:polyferredoxin/Flp pilus assembly protein TadD